MFKNQKGFTVAETLLVILIITVIGFGGYYVYHTNHNTTKIASASNKTSVNKSQQTSTNNPYIGWNSYTLSQEKLSFKYPSSWKLINERYSRYNLNGNGIPLGDNITLKTPGSWSMTISAGQQTPIDASGLGQDYIDKNITFLGQPALLVFIDNSSTNTNHVGTIILSKPNGNFLAKNVPIVPNSQSSSRYIQVILETPTTSNGLSVKTILNSQNYKNAKLVIESMNY